MDEDATEAGVEGLGLVIVGEAEVGGGEGGGGEGGEIAVVAFVLVDYH